MIRAAYKAFHAGDRSLPKRLGLSLAEGAQVGAELTLAQVTKRLIARSRRAPSQGVIVLPGFLGHDRFNRPLIDFLKSAGHQASGWMNGRNLGPRGDTVEKMQREIEFRAALSGDKVTLIGHSLGGIYARELARTRPDLVERVITLGSPSSRGNNTRTAVNKVYQSLNLNSENDKPFEELVAPPPVPVTSVFTRSDSVIDWRTALQQDGHNRCENIEVYGSHCGLTLNASVWFLLLDRMMQGGRYWQPFDNSGWRRLIYPVARQTI